jgi:preprotein translocase subunit SecD
VIHIARWQIAVIVLILIGGIVFAAPNFLGYAQDEELPEWMPGRVTLGLDLQGGSHLLYEVGLEGIVKERLEGVEDSVRTELGKLKIGYTDLDYLPHEAGKLDDDEVRFKLTDPATVEQVRGVLRDIAQGFDVALAADGAATIRFTQQALTDLRVSTIGQSIEVVRRRVDALGTREPSIQRQGDDRILIQLPGVKDPAQVKRIIGTTAKMTFRFVDERVGARGMFDRPPPPGTVPPIDEVLPGDEPDQAGKTVYYAVQKRVMVDGGSLTKAAVQFQNGQPVVGFEFDSIGGKRFGDATKANIGKLFAIVLDGKVISAPVIRSAIIGGSGIIEGRFTTQEAQDLVTLLNAGALPANLTVLEERTVGADLGADSIAAGIFASELALVLIVVAMAVLYGLFGIFAVLALAFNGILLLAALSVIGATLTLPGIAGIVLTLGMAVDANVLIFERIREELRAGRGPVSAMEAGYRGAMGTIIDTHVTTLISGLILLQFGTGPVKGFAVTLSIGIVISIFTAVYVTRLFTILWFQRARPKVLPI